MILVYSTEYFIKGVISKYQNKPNFCRGYYIYRFIEIKKSYQEDSILQVYTFDFFFYIISLL